MRTKMYKMRSLAVGNGPKPPVDLDLEFEGKRAFVIWDSVTLGKFQFKARLEINPKLLQRLERASSCDYLYCGQLVLPRPQDN
jgi:hypothetical protein